MLTLWQESYDQPRKHIKKQRCYFANKVHLVKAVVFPVVMYGRVSELDNKESWAPKSWCFWTVVLEKTLESPLDCKETHPVNPKGNQSWYSLEGLMLKLKHQYLATWCEQLTHWKRLWYWEGLKAECDGWMVSLTWWTWVWVSSGSWWWTGKPGMLQSMGSQRVGHDWVTELNWTDYGCLYHKVIQVYSI